MPMKLEASFSLTNIDDCESYPVAINKIDYNVGLKLQDLSKCCFC